MNSRRITQYPYTIWLGRFPDNFRCHQRELHTVQFKVASIATGMRLGLNTLLLNAQHR